MKLNTYISNLNRKQDMSRHEAAMFLGQILDDQTLSDEQITIALTAITKKGETINEILGFLDAMQSRMINLDIGDDAIDTCGTGGDRSGTFNISTASAIVVASHGVPVAKHGNRSASSKCGSADVLETLGLAVDNSPDQAIESINKLNFCFLFAQQYHPSLKRLGGIRRQLGFPTVFNILGPLLNPARVKRQVIGTFSSKNADRIAEIVTNRGTTHTLVIHSNDGLDEASLGDSTNIIEIKNGKVKEYVIKPDDYNLASATVAELQGGTAQVNAEIIRKSFQRTEEMSAHQRIIALNSGLALYIAGATNSISDGVDLARKLLKSEKPNDLFRKLASHAEN